MPPIKKSYDLQKPNARDVFVVEVLESHNPQVDVFFPRNWQREYNLLFKDLDKITGDWVFVVLHDDEGEHGVGDHVIGGLFFRTEVFKRMLKKLHRERVAIVHQLSGEKKSCIFLTVPVTRLLEGLL